MPAGRHIDVKMDGSSSPGVVKSVARRRVLAVITSEGNGGGGLREEMRVRSHV